MKPSDYYIRQDELKKLLKKVYIMGYIWTAQDPSKDETAEQPLRLWYAFKEQPEFCEKDQIWKANGDYIKLSQAYSFTNYRHSCVQIEEYLNSTLSSRDRVVVTYDDGTQETGFVTHDSRYLPVYLDSGYKFFFNKDRSNMQLLMTKDNQMLPVAQIKPAQVTFARLYPYGVGTKVVYGVPAQAGMCSFSQGVIESIENDFIYVNTGETTIVFYQVLSFEKKDHELDVIATRDSFSLYVSL